MYRMPSAADDRAVSVVRQNPAVTLLSLALLSPAEILLSQAPLDCALIFLLCCCYYLLSISSSWSTLSLGPFSFPPFSCRLFSRNASLSYCRLREAHTTVLPPSFSSPYSDTHLVCAVSK
ncbi:uncharacterized protein ASPGLDRAFT_751158 [Aspergillus glaucus CBS 516.65]|uniref:Uncharacterized protein n=1 Tax=Aspergillus glaucus CBS 516.65 TaxID=1160497 RepID=A0A1L9VY91_ASPGL|nr:hypothetical protein ASPGLDRAFT_751158 [Aspergillus glaucus CBS 516.65]OJJ88865.1 hypothetical protein ASPGLDRAFT_751158 [Aspergillus glaucus CBS 516.65]